MIVIPAFNPDSKLIEMIDGLYSFSNIQNIPILIIDDGSNCTISSREFSKIKSRYQNVNFIKHKKNEGKGAAIKTGIQYAQSVQATFIITVDADGQHATKDVLKLCAQHKKNPGMLIIGTRGFDASVPFRSRFGNLLTKKIFNFLNNSQVEDTQSGLRVIPCNIFKAILNLKGRRYEYEQEVLCYCAKNGLIAPPVYIETIYEAGNPSSHFNKVRDSILIYYVLLRSFIANIIVAVVDLSLFSLFIFITNNLNVSLFSTRVVMIVVYFVIMKYFVFKSSGRLAVEFPKTTVLIIINSILVYLIFNYLWVSPEYKVLSYMLVNSVLFIFNFLIQRELIFIKRS